MKNGFELFTTCWISYQINSMFDVNPTHHRQGLLFVKVACVPQAQLIISLWLVRAKKSIKQRCQARKFLLEALPVHKIGF